MKPLTRRDFLKVGGLAVLGTAGAATLNQNHQTAEDPHKAHLSHGMQQDDHGDLPDRYLA